MNSATTFLGKDENTREKWQPYFEAAKVRYDAWDAVYSKGLPNELIDSEIRTAAQQALTQQVDLILDEEQVAWSHARELLADFGFPSLDDCDRCAEQGLHFHRYRLGRDELWATDRP